MNDLGPLIIALIQLHTSDGLPLYLNPKAVTTMRAPRSGEAHVSSGVHCLVNLSDGKWVGVKEGCDQVRAVIDAAKKD